MTVLLRVEQGYTYTGDLDLIVLTCPECGVTYAIPHTLQKNARSKGEFKIMWHCPNGHELGYGESDVDRERKRAEQAEANARRSRERADAEYDLRRDTERRLSAQKGATTRARKRHAAGVCPCCNRTFVQLRRHMQNKHPDYKPEASP